MSETPKKLLHFFGKVELGNCSTDACLLDYTPNGIYGNKAMFGFAKILTMYSMIHNNVQYGGFYMGVNSRRELYNILKEEFERDNNTYVWTEMAAINKLF